MSKFDGDETHKLSNEETTILNKYFKETLAEPEYEPSDDDLREMEAWLDERDDDDGLNEFLEGN